MVGIQGSKTFEDYAIFLSGMAVVLKRLQALREPEDADIELVIFSAGPKKIKDMALEFINVSNFKTRGITAKLVNVPESWFKTNFYKLEMFSFFCNKKEVRSDLANFMDAKDIEVQVHRYEQVKQNKYDKIYNKGR